jgi:hypothetical protein
LPIIAASYKQEELTRLNNEAAALATEIGSVEQAPHLEREASRNQAKKVEQLQAVEAQASVLEAQLVERRMRLGEAGKRPRARTSRPADRPTHFLEAVGSKFVRQMQRAASDSFASDGYSTRT